MADGGSKKSGEQPIIIKKIIKGGHGHHGGAWKVAYADFVTAMMAFFIVMWILAASSSVKETIVAYFDDPGAFSFVTGKMAVPLDLGLKPIPGRRMGEESGEGAAGESELEFSGKLDENAQSELIKEIKEMAVKDSIDNAEQLKKVGKTLEESIEQQIKENKENAELLNSIKFNYTEEGLEINLVETRENLFFKTGSSDFNVASLKLIDKLGKELGKMPNSIEVEGHTDSKAYKNVYGYTNWELSADRANTARSELEKRGLWEGQIKRVSGYADKKLLYPNNPFDDKNRRVTLFVRFMQTEDIVKEYTSQYDISGEEIKTSSDKKEKK